MNNETYKNMLEFYEKIKMNQAKCRKVQSLLLDPKVKEFIKYSDMDYKVIKGGYHVYTHAEEIEMLIRKTLPSIKYEETNKICIVINNIKIIDGNKYYFKDDSLGIDYRTYHNLECEESELVPSCMIKRYEKNNKVIFNNTNLDNDLFYKKVQLEYFKYLLKNSQKDAKELILKKYKN